MLNIRLQGKNCRQQFKKPKNQQIMISILVTLKTTVNNRLQLPCYCYFLYLEF